LPMLNQIGSYKSSEITEHKGAVAAQPGAYVEEMDFARPTGRPWPTPIDVTMMKTSAVWGTARLHHGAALRSHA
jgi:hypothetical protein